MSNTAENVQEEEIDLTAANAVIDKYIDMKGALMPVLQEIQESYGYVPEPTVHLVADRLNVYCLPVLRSADV
jgi:NADH-quinone oxidoreductase subunit E